jgi:hypothetical protein
VCFVGVDPTLLVRLGSPDRLRPSDILCVAPNALKIAIFRPTTEFLWKNRATGSSGPLKLPRSHKNLAIENWLTEDAAEAKLHVLHVFELDLINKNCIHHFKSKSSLKSHFRPRLDEKKWKMLHFGRKLGTNSPADGR